MPDFIHILVHKRATYSILPDYFFALLVIGVRRHVCLIIYIYIYDHMDAECWGKTNGAPTGHETYGSARRGSRSSLLRMGVTYGTDWTGLDWTGTWDVVTKSRRGLE